MEKYAVLISGCEADSGKDEFWNDVVAVRKALLKNGFPIENIYVLYADGKDYRQPNPVNNWYNNPDLKPLKNSVTDFAATKVKVSDVFNGLANGTNGMPRLQPQDLLFIWTFGHGLTLLISWYLKLNDGYMNNKDFANLVNKIPYDKRIICMQQCFSGGFINDLNDGKTVILTACHGLQIANRCDDKNMMENETIGNVAYHHGEFNYHLFSAITQNTIQGSTVISDTNSDRFVTMDEVFEYIRRNDTRWTESTQYSDGNSKIGKNVHL